MEFGVDNLIDKAKVIISKWNILNGGEKLDKWLAQFSDSEKILMLNLLCGFYYYSENQLLQDYKRLCRKFICTCPNWDDNKTFFTKIYKAFNQSGHSDIFYIEFLKINNLLELSSTDPVLILQKLPENKRIVFVDDFSGSGDSFIKTIKKIETEFTDLKCKDIYFLVDHCTNSAKNKIKIFAEQNFLKITIISLTVSDKAFSPKIIFNDPALEEAKQLHSLLLQKYPVSMPLGYGEIQALVSFSYNTPNNTLGLFWQNLDNYFAFFERYTSKRLGLKQLIRQAEQRKKQIDTKKPIRNIDEYRVLLFTAYCVNKKSEFNVADACRDFGFTEDQVIRFLEYITRRGYVKNNYGKYVETDLLYNAKYKCRFSSFLETFDNESYEKISDILNREYTPLNFSKIFQGYKKGG